ncbi:translation elongation factor Ts [Patescibacteria group bacterium]
MKVDIEDLKKLRIDTKAGIADCRQALEDSKGDYGKAKKLITKRGLEKAEKKASIETSQGIIEAYVHATSKVGVLLEIRTQTDFVARNEEFKKVAHEIAMQIAAMNPKSVKSLLASEYIRDSAQTIDMLVKSAIAKLGENITIARFIRYQLGEE